MSPRLNLHRKFNLPSFLSREALIFAFAKHRKLSQDKPLAGRPFVSLALGGDERVRTDDPLLAKQVLSQLSYTPISKGAPFLLLRFLAIFLALGPSKLNNDSNSRPVLNLDFRPGSFSQPVLHRKEVIQPHLPIRLPCYDFTPVANPTFGSAPLAVRLLTSGITGSHGVTGGVYKARERIHRGMLIRDY